MLGYLVIMSWSKPERGSAHCCRALGLKNICAQCALLYRLRSRTLLDLFWCAHLSASSFHSPLGRLQLAKIKLSSLVVRAYLLISEKKNSAASDVGWYQCYLYRSTMGIMTQMGGNLRLRISPPDGWKTMRMRVALIEPTEWEPATRTSAAGEYLYG